MQFASCKALPDKSLTGCMVAVGGALGEVAAGCFSPHAVNVNVAAHNASKNTLGTEFSIPFQINAL
jgi:hypothetical protein